jgi:hypothetical protein
MPIPYFPFVHLKFLSFRRFDFVITGQIIFPVRSSKFLQVGEENKSEYGSRDSDLCVKSSK